MLRAFTVGQGNLTEGLNGAAKLASFKTKLCQVCVNQVLLSAGLWTRLLSLRGENFWHLSQRTSGERILTEGGGTSCRLGSTPSQPSVGWVPSSES